MKETEEFRVWDEEGFLEENKGLGMVAGSKMR